MHPLQSLFKGAQSKYFRLFRPYTVSISSLFSFPLQYLKIVRSKKKCKKHSYLTQGHTKNRYWANVAGGPCLRVSQISGIIQEALFSSSFFSFHMLLRFHACYFMYLLCIIVIAFSFVNLYLSFFL